VGFAPGFGTAFWFNALSVGAGELVACYGLGTILLAALSRNLYLRSFIPAGRLSCAR